VGAQGPRALLRRLCTALQPRCTGAHAAIRLREPRAPSRTAASAAVRELRTVCRELRTVCRGLRTACRGLRTIVHRLRTIVRGPNTRGQRPA
jgi:hypothetical protein